MERACNISKEKAGKSSQASGEWDMWLTWDVRHCSWPVYDLLCTRSSLNTAFLRLSNRILWVLMVGSHHWLSWWTQSSSVHPKYTSWWIPRNTCTFLLRYFSGCSQLCYDWQTTRSPRIAQTFLTVSWFLLLVSKSIIFIWGQVTNFIIFKILLLTPLLLYLSLLSSSLFLLDILSLLCIDSARLCSITTLLIFVSWS